MTSVVDPSTVLGSPSELDLFTVPPTQVAITGGFWEVCRAKNQIDQDNDGPYVFELDSGPYFAFPAKNYLQLRLALKRVDQEKPQKKAGAKEGDDPIPQPRHTAPRPIADDDLVSPINYIGSTFFKQLKVFIGSRLVYDSYDTYAYQSIIAAELNHSQDAKTGGMLAAGMFGSPSPTHFWGSYRDDRWKERKKWFQQKEVELFAPLNADIFNHGRLFPRGTRIRVELYRNSDNFALINQNSMLENHREYKLEINQINWRIRLCDLSKSAALALDQQIARSPAKFPIRKVVMYRLSLQEGVQEMPHQLICSGQIPRRIICGMVSREAFHGDSMSDPLRFRHFDISEITLVAGGIQYLRDPLRTNFGRRDFMRAFLNLQESIGNGAPSTSSCGITPDYFMEGLCLFAFDLSPSEWADGAQWEVNKSGSTYINIRFEVPLPKAVELLIHAEYDDILRINSNREVIPGVLQ